MEDQSAVLLSVIIPMYNVAHFLEECVATVRIKNIQYEILMINDGSPDSSLQIATQLAQQNSHIKVISQENKGLGGARNTGIINANGKYILFLDADDRLVMQDFSFLIASPEDQIIQLASQNVTHDRKVISHYSPIRVDGVSGMDFWIENQVMPSACNKLYLRTFLLKNALFFKEHLLSEDIEFNTRAFFLAGRISAFNVVVQNFVQTSGSITRSRSIEARKRLFKDLCRIINLLVEYRNLNSTKPKDYSFFNKIIGDIGMGVLNFGVRNPVDTAEIYKIKDYLLKNEVPLFSMKYDNPAKNIFKKVLRVPYSINLLKLFLNK